MELINKGKDRMTNCVEVEKLSEIKYKINISVPSQEVDKKFDDFFKIAGKSAQVPGFRKGKAPLSFLKQTFYEKAKPTVAQALVGEYFTKAIQENSINPVGKPEMDSKFNNGKYPGLFGFDNSFSASLIVEVLPKIDPAGYLGMELDLPNIDLNKMVEAKVLESREQFAERKQISDRPAQTGDSVVIDFTGMIDGKPFGGGSASGHVINSLGSGSLVFGLEAGIVGMSLNETKNIPVKFPDDYRMKNLAGQNTTFDVTLKSIVEKKLSEVNVDLALMLGFTSIEEMMEKFKSDAQENKSAMERQALDKTIVNMLIAKNVFDVPSALIDDEFRRIMTISKNKVEDLQSDVIASIKKIAETNVKRAVLFDAIYEKEKSLEVTPEELNKLLEQHSKANNMSKDDLVSNLYNSNQMDNFVGILRTSKVVDFIISQAKRKENV